MKPLLMIENLMGKLVNGNERDFGRCLYRITDFLEADAYGGAPNEISDVQTTVGTLYRNMNINDSIIFNNLIGRYYALFFHHLPKMLKDKKLKNEHFDFVRKFEEVTGVRLKLYLVLAMLIWAYFEKNPDEKLQLLKNPANFILDDKLAHFKPKYIEEARKGFRVFSKKRDWFSKEFAKSRTKEFVNYYGVSPFLRAPFYELPNGNFFPLDLNYFQQKVTAGVKWDVHDYIKEQLDSAETSEKRKQHEFDRNRLMAFYGRVLESYTTDLLKRIAKKQAHSIFLHKVEDTLGVDYLLYDLTHPECLIIMELTSSMIHYRISMSGDLNEILRQFKEWYVEKDLKPRLESQGKPKSSKEKIRQLSDAVSLVKNGKLHRLNKYYPEIKKIYTVLITETGFPQFPNLTERYRQIINNANLLSGHLNNFQFIDLEELELIEPLIGKKGFRMVELLANRLESDIPDYPFKNYLHKNKLMYRNKAVGKPYHKVLVDAQRYMKHSFKNRVLSLVSFLKFIFKKETRY